MSATAGDARRGAARAAFDRLAAEYDTLAGGEIFRLLRARTHRAFARHLAPDARVLEIGCGTGVDTCFLASRGARVVACDPSEEMVSRALRRLAHQQLASHACVLLCGLEDVHSYLEAHGLDHRFDLIVSNFGALNCVQHLAPLAALVRCYLEPGGMVLLGLMTRLCAMEAAYFAARGQPRLARRRLAPGAVDVPVAGICVPTYYHRIKDVVDALGREARLQRVEGIGVAVPPPYLEARWQQLPPRVRSAAATLDGWLSPWPPFNRVGDHVLLCFTRERAHG